MSRYSAGNRVNAEFDVFTVLSHKVRYMLDLRLGLSQGHAVSGNNNDALGFCRDVCLWNRGLRRVLPVLDNPFGMGWLIRHQVVCQCPNLHLVLTFALIEPEGA